MKRPTWKLVIGILAIVLGGWGVVGGFFSILSTTYYLMEPEVEMVGKASDSDTSNGKPPPHTTADPEHSENAQKGETDKIDRAVEEPSQSFAKNTTWAVAREIISFLVSGAYFLAGILLITKSFGTRFFYIVLAASILWSVVQAVVYAQAQISMLMAIAPFLAPKILIDVLLGSVVYVGSKQPPVEKTLSTSHAVSDETPLVGLPKFLKVGIPLLTGIPAALFALVFPFWIMGVPGVENDYARGWRMGLDVVMYYPIAWIVIFGVAWFLKKIIPRDRQAVLDIVVSVCLMIFFAVALLRLGQAFQIMAM